MGCAASNESEESQYSRKACEKEEVPKAANIEELNLELLQAAGGEDAQKKWFEAVCPDGALKKDKFVALLLCLLTDEKSPASKDFLERGPVYHLLNDLASMMRSALKTEHGKIREDLQAKLRPKIRLALGPILNVVFDAIDVDNSGSMEYKEFDACVKMAMTRGMGEEGPKDFFEFFIRLVDVNRDGKLQRSELMHLAQQIAKISSITAHAVLDSSMEAWLEMMNSHVPADIFKKEKIAEMKGSAPPEVGSHSGELLEHPMFVAFLGEAGGKIPGAKEIFTDMFKAFTGWLDDILTHKSGDTCTNAQWQKISGKTVKSFINMFQTITKHVSETAPKVDPSLEEPMKAIGAKPADAQTAVNAFLDILSRNTFQIGEASFEFFKFGNAGAGEVSWASIELFAAIFKPGKPLADKAEEWANSCVASDKVSAASALATCGTAGFMFAHAIATMFIEGCVTFLAEPAAEQFIATLSGGGKEFLILPTLLGFIMAKGRVDELPADLKSLEESAGPAEIKKVHEILKKELSNGPSAMAEAEMKKYHAAVMVSFK